MYFKNYLNILKSVKLFDSISEDEIESMLNCLNAEIVNVKKNENVLSEGDKPEKIGILLIGQMHIVKEDYDGNRILIASVTPGEIFAEALCCAGLKESPVTATADVNSTVMLINYKNITRDCQNHCSYHKKLVENILKMTAQKNIMLQKRLDIISVHSIREKVLRYLDTLDAEKGKKIEIPFNREEMANYLCVERSALSHELSRMKKDGIIDYKKDKFKLL